jgi:caffeoyl-CoA O-methyltransferase
MIKRKSWLVPDKIQKYCRKNTTETSKVLEELKKETYKKTPWPTMQIDPLQGSLLKLLVKITKARRVLEVGTFTGYSALSMAEGLPKGGKIITCEIEPKFIEIAKKFWKKSPHGRKIKVIVGPAVNTLKKLKGKFDFVFIDADKENYINYWNLCIPKVKKGGIIAVDNVLWKGHVVNPKRDAAKKIARFNNHARKDKRMETVMLPIVDGMTIAVKR